MIIIDTPRLYPGKRKKYCHMISDNINDLHSFAESLGVKRGWFEKSSGGIPHYDLNEIQWRAAMNAGAIEVTYRGMATCMQLWYPSSYKLIQTKNQLD